MTRKHGQSYAVDLQLARPPWRCEPTASQSRGGSAGWARGCTGQRLPGQRPRQRLPGQRPPSQRPGPATRSSDRQPPDAEGSMARRHTFSRSVADNSFEESCGIRGNIWFGIQKYFFFKLETFRNISETFKDYWNY